LIEIVALSGPDARKHVPALAEVLLDCVAGGASVSFMASVTREEAEAFFAGALNEVERGKRVLLAAFLDSRLIGTVQLVPATPPNQPHRADVAKLLVQRSARGQGVARALMAEVDAQARVAGKTLLVLDTVTGDAAERLYESIGWTRVGVIPRYALYPDGRPCDTTVFYKELE
jgi:GNAT superfamily N-acetyltransferase